MATEESKREESKREESKREASKRIPSGIEGLDNLISGGLVKDSTTLIAGRTGTGKTIGCMQFLYNGAVMYNEPGVFVSVEETGKELKEDVRTSFGWDISELEKKDKLRIVEIGVEEQSLTDIKHLLYQQINKIKATRLVLDSISVFEIFGRDIYKIRHEVLDLLRLLKTEGVTSLVTAQIPETNPEALSTAEMIEFVVDNIIKLDYYPILKGHTRAITIRKMRRTSHSTDVHPFKITKDGILIRGNPILLP